MILYPPIYSRISGTGSYLPEKVLTNADLEVMVQTSHEWIVERTGIEQRHIAADNQLTSDLAEHASREAIKNAGLEVSDIDLIIVATTTPDRIFPSTACLLQKCLGIHGPAAFDVQAVCSGFIYGLSIADKFIKTGSAKHALVVGAETLSRIIDWTDRSTCILFGDGAGAVVLSASDSPGIVSTHLHADGQYDDLLTVPGGVSSGRVITPPPHAQTSEENRYFIQMRGNEVFKMAVKTLGRIVDESLAAADLEKSDIDWLVPHQANTRIIKATAKKLNMPMDHVVLTVNKHGNTSAASVPLALHDAVASGKIKRGDTLLLEAFGGGFTWGSAIIDY